MQADEVAPNHETFVALVQGCASVGDVVGARVYFEAAKSRGLHLGDHPSPQQQQQRWEP